ncbi:MAG TPA: DUF1566 domain-containing protein, partial [Leptospiraceae bacterium]|nr:DUF1566 domain-containing protein [Leptospiraceae bacterium]
PSPVIKTGQTGCWDGAGASVSCTGTGIDGEFQYGRARSFTDNGDGTVTENGTGLYWQKCSAGLSGATCATGTAATDTWANAQTYCSGLSLAGRTWRMPTYNELANLANYSVSAPAADSAFFPNTVSGNYWVNNTYTASPTFAYYFTFLAGASSTLAKTSTLNARCVSGTSVTSSYTDNGDGTVRDQATGLLWQKCSAGQSGSSCGTGTASTFTWAPALTYCNSLSLASKTWRLPNINELRTIIDVSAAGLPYINGTAFPNTPTSVSQYWSSDSLVSPTTYAWYIYLLDGSLAYMQKSLTSYARCVAGP